MPDPRTPSTDILGRLASVPSSGLKMMKSWVSQALPGNSRSSRRHKARMRDMARYFPDYVHPSSDAELSAYQLCGPTDAASPPKHSPTDIKPIMAGMNQLRADFNLRIAAVAPAPPMAAVASGIHSIMHAKASPGADSAAAALQLQRQLYPASPLSAGSGFIPAIHSAHAQPFGSCESGSEAALCQEHSVTPGQDAAQNTHISPCSPVDEARPKGTQASHSTLHMKQAQAPSAQDCATSGSADPAAQPSAAVAEFSEAEEDRPHSKQTALLPGGTDQAVVEQQHSEMQEILMTKPEAELARCLLTAGTDAAGGSAGMNQLRADFKLRTAVVAPATPMAAISSGLHSIMHAKASPGTDPAAATLQLQRQLYPASPLSAGSGFIPAIHSAHAQPFGSCESGSEAALCQEHSVTPTQEAVQNTHISPCSPVDEARPGRTQASHSTLHMKQAQASYAQDCAASGSADTAAQPSAAVAEASKAEKDRPHSEQTALLSGGTDQAVVEQQHSEMQEILMTKPEVELARCLLTASTDAAGDSGNTATGAGSSEPDTLFSREPLISCDTHKDHLYSHPIHIEPKDEEELAGAQPSQSLQSLSVDIPDQAHVRLPSQPIGTSKSAGDIDVGASQKSLTSHALHFCHGYDEDLDVTDQSDVANSGSGSNCNCLGTEDAVVDPNHYPYIDEHVPSQEAQQPQVLDRSVATAAYLTCSSCLTLHSMPMQPWWRLSATYQLIRAYLSTAW